MRMMLWGLSLLSYAWAGWDAARNRSGAVPFWLCLFLSPLCLVWALQDRPEGYEAYKKLVRLSVSVALPAGIWLLSRTESMSRLRAWLDALAQLGMAILWGMVAAAKGGFPRAAGLLLIALSGLLMLPYGQKAALQGERKWAAYTAAAGVCAIAAGCLAGAAGAEGIAMSLGAMLTGMALGGFSSMEGIRIARLMTAGVLPGIYALAQPFAAPVYAVTLDMPFFMLFTALVYIPPMVDGRTRRWQGAALLGFTALYATALRWLGA